MKGFERVSKQTMSTQKKNFWMKRKKVEAGIVADRLKSRIISKRGHTLTTISFQINPDYNCTPIT